MPDAVCTIRDDLHPDRWQVVNEVDRIIADHEQAMQDIREGFLDAVFIIAVIALFVWGCWVFA